MKQETLEEAVERIFKDSNNFVPRIFFMRGAEWQQENSYSEEDLKEAFGMNDKDWICFEEWFEQFKKKQNATRQFS
jgi:hypothetical protein